MQVTSKQAPSKLLNECYERLHKLYPDDDVTIHITRLENGKVIVALDKSSGFDDQKPRARAHFCGYLKAASECGNGKPAELGHDPCRRGYYDDDTSLTFESESDLALALNALTKKQEEKIEVSPARAK